MYAQHDVYSISVYEVIWEEKLRIDVMVSLIICFYESLWGFETDTFPRGQEDRWSLQAMQLAEIKQEQYSLYTSLILWGVGYSGPDPEKHLNVLFIWSTAVSAFVPYLLEARCHTWHG